MAEMDSASDRTLDVPPVLIVPYVDGPLVVRGRVTIESADGTPIEHSGTVALCRCGVSTIKPFCDGTHKLVKFRSDPKKTA